MAHYKSNGKGLWAGSVILTQGNIGIMDRLDMVSVIGTIHITGVPLDLPIILVQKRGYIC